MTSHERIPYPFKVTACDDETQKKIAQDFLGRPNGLVSANHWGFKLSGTVTEKEVEDAYNRPLDPSDIWMVGPPKCGTTWGQEMIWLIANDLDYEGAKTPLLPNRWSFIDLPLIIDKETLDKLLGPNKEHKFPANPNRPPKFVKSHLPLSMINPKLIDTCKVIYVARNPKDACVSFYKHCQLMRSQDYTGDLEKFMEYFMDGEIVASPFIEHMIEAWNLRHHPNMCFLFYEDMKRDLKSQIRKVAKFLGKTYSDDQIAKLADHLHIDNFRKNPFVSKEWFNENSFMHTDRGSLVRKGQAGDWKNHFTSEMNARFDKWMEQKLKGSDLTFVMELETQE